MITLKHLFSLGEKRIWIVCASVLLLTSFGWVFFPPTGIHKPQAIGPYLNNALPSLTPAGGGSVDWSVVPAFPNLTFNNPLAITMYPDPAVDLMFVSSRLGTIEYFDASDPNVNTKTLMADFTAETAVVHDGGFLGMVFHPDFAANPNRKWVYLYYIANGPHIFNGQSGANNGPYSCDCECFSCATTGRWYGSYLRLARYDVTGTINTGLSIDKSTEKRMINIRLYNATHRGGGLVFGDDGYLYLTIGDQARRTTAQGITKAADNSDNVNMFEGGVVRLDVNIDNPSPDSHDPTYVVGPESNVIMHDYDNNCDGLNPEPTTTVALTEDVTGAFYRIPNDNPQWYPDNNSANDPDPANYFEEFITVGHRAPHRMTKDKMTGDLWIGEVGAGSREEINALQPELLVRNGLTTQGGGNFGWPKHEGYLVGQFTTCGSNNLDLTLGSLYDPVVDFPRSGAKGANAIIGGYVYRGSKFAAQLGGRYICGGYSQNRIFAIDFKKDANGKIVPDFSGGGTQWDAIEELTSFTPGQMITWGEDHDGELYIGKIGNSVNLYTLSATGIGSPAPQYLSQTGFFTDLSTLTTAKGIIPYDLIEPFWSDGAKKYRWLAIPNDGSHDTAAEQIKFSENGQWEFPVGSVLVKHFELETGPGVFRRLETRFEVHGNDGNYYYLTYKWNTEQTDAELLSAALDESIPVEGGAQVWHYPSRSECVTCHQVAVGSILGPNTRNLNRSIVYPGTGLEANQLLTLSHIGALDQPVAEADLPGLLTLAAKDDDHNSLEFRARSYLDVNCGYCHQPATGNRANFDARIQTPLQQQSLVNGPVMDNLGISGATYITPQSISQSIIHHRMDILTEGIAMPPLAKNKIDDPGVQLIADWINSLALSPPPALASGLIGRYHEGMELNDQRFERIDATVNFNWGNGSPNAGLVGNNQFSARWTGFVRPQYSETYTFYTRSDDGVRLWINGQLLIDNWTDHAPTENSGTIALTAGTDVSLLLEFYENGGGAVMELRWSSASLSKEVIPANRLFHVPEATECNGPVAVFQASPSTGGFPLAVSFDASATYHPDDASISLSWDFGDGQTGSGVQPAHIFTGPGTYPVKLTVTSVDEPDCEDEETIVVNVLNNEIPTLALSATPSSGDAPLVVLFSATASDPETDPLTYHWDFGDGTQRTGLTPGTTHTYIYPGTYEATLTVNDGYTDVQAAVTVIVDHAYSDLGIFIKNRDVGAVGAIGSAFHSSGTYTLEGSGADIWNTEDEFQYIYRPYQAYGEIIARVQSVSNSDPSAKAGVMFRESTAAGAAYIMIAARPDHQLDLQWRTSAAAPDNITTNFGLVGNIGEVKFVRLVRLDDCFTGFYSTVGPEGPWIQIGSQVMINMPEEALVGLAVTAHNDGMLATAQFDNVQLNSLEAVQPVVVTVKVLLQGPWNGTSMNTGLASASLVPMAQPYNDLPADYWGNETILSYPTDMVDWVLVQLRDAGDPTCIVAQRACFVRNDGYLMDLDGSEGVDFGNLEIDRGYVSIMHRNHLGVMTQSAVDLR